MGRAGVSRPACVGGGGRVCGSGVRREAREEGTRGVVGMRPEWVGDGGHSADTVEVGAAAGDDGAVRVPNLLQGAENQSGSQMHMILASKYCFTRYGYRC